MPTRPELPELDQLEALGARVGLLRLGECAAGELPVWGLTLGTSAPEAPLFVITGGVHGLERIGSQIVLAWIEGLLASLEWDEVLRHQLERVRLVAVPVVNPGGMLRRSRCNPRGVDLMRNAPVEADPGTHFLLGGHRISSRLPWYRGKPGMLEPEARAVTDFVRAQGARSRSILALDVHSGFGVVDQLWFPYARSREPFPSLAETGALAELIDRAHPNHAYRIEPQARHYTTHGDLWDWLYDERRESGGGAFVPLTLELGSWMWVRKNPVQLFSFLGPFNPIKPHRKRRALRRHLHLLDLLFRTAAAPEAWAELDPVRRVALRSAALSRWYK